MADDPLRRLDAGIHQVICDIQQAPDECFVGRNTLCLECLPVRRIGQTLGHKATLRAHRHNDGVFHLLRFYQAQNFCAVVLEPIRPAQTTTGHFATTQVNPLHTRGIHKDLEHG